MPKLCQEISLSLTKGQFSINACRHMIAYSWQLINFSRCLGSDQWSSCSHKIRGSWWSFNDIQAHRCTLSTSVRRLSLRQKSSCRSGCVYPDLGKTWPPWQPTRHQQQAGQARSNWRITIKAIPGTPEISHIYAPVPWGPRSHATGKVPHPLDQSLTTPPFSRKGTDHIALPW